MSAQFMRRNIRISVRLTEEEHRLLKEKMARIGVTNVCITSVGGKVNVIYINT